MKKAFFLIAMCLTLSAISQTTVYQKNNPLKRKAWTGTRASYVACIVYFNQDTINNPGQNWWVDASNFNIGGIIPQPNEYLYQDAAGLITKPFAEEQKNFTEYIDSSYTAIRMTQIKNDISAATQTLSISNGSISISAGNTVSLPTYSISAGTGISISQSSNTYTVSNSLPNPTYTVDGLGTGTVYTLSTTSSKIDFGTTDPVITIAQAGTYMIFVNIKLDYVGLTTALQTANFKLRRTNNTASDLTGAVTNINIPSATLLTATGPDTDMRMIIYTTSNTNDVIELWGNRQNGISIVGSINVSEASVTAVRIY